MGPAVPVLYRLACQVGSDGIEFGVEAGGRPGCRRRLPADPELPLRCPVRSDEVEIGVGGRPGCHRLLPPFPCSTAVHAKWAPMESSSGSKREVGRDAVAATRPTPSSPFDAQCAP